MDNNQLIYNLKLLFIMLVGFGVMVGLIRISSLPKIFARILIGSFLIGILFSVGREYWHQLTAPWQWLILMLLMPLFLVILLRVILGANLFRHVLGSFIYDMLKQGFLLFFRLVSNLAKAPFDILRWFWKR